ncbi:MAG: OsmC family protein [Holophagales bacterium]|nr:OsmC family protein [Holophagales bacterium]
MSVGITGRYEGQLRVKLTHGPSGAELHTAAPVDNNGDGSSFSPTDLVAAALGACMVTIMGIQAQRHGIELEGCHFTAEKHMVSDPRRIGSIPITLHMPAGLTESERKRLERGALTCPVHRSLLPEVGKEVRFLYPD